MTDQPNSHDLLAHLRDLNAQELRRLLVEHLTKRKLGLSWERDALEHDDALNADIVLPRIVAEYSHAPTGAPADFVHRNLIIEGDNFDSLRLLKSTHAGKIRVIYIDPPYNTGKRDWVYNDRYVGEKDRWRHSLWLEFLYRRLVLARDLLTPDGVVLVSINDENRARLELLLDEVFPNRRLGSFVWRTKDTGNDLSQRLSHVHEHVLAYANSAFKFNGKQTDRSKFRNPDNDPRGDWSPQPLTKAHTYQERANTYYPIQNPETGYWYPCDPDRVWSYASEAAIRKRFAGDEEAVQVALAGLRSETIEQLIARKLVYFPPCKPDEIKQFESRQALDAAIAAGAVPVLPKKKTPLLRSDLPDLDFWIGKPIAPGRPSRKEHWAAKPEEERVAPFSSWIAGINEDVGDDDGYLETLFTLRTTRGGVATDEIKAILGAKVFQFPKPLSLIKSLLSQSTQPGDIVLDFFAGSGTTAQVVLELNAEGKGPPRRYILCSSTEATDKELEKNLCRDITAERMRRVSSGYGGRPGYTADEGGEFAYLQLDKVAAADTLFETTPHSAFALLSLRLTQSIRAGSGEAIQHIARADDCDILLCTKVDPASVETLAAWPKLHGVNRIAVYCERPHALQEALESREIEAVCHSLQQALQGSAG